MSPPGVGPKTPSPKKSPNVDRSLDSSGLIINTPASLDENDSENGVSFELSEILAALPPGVTIYVYPNNTTNEMSIAPPSNEMSVAPPTNEPDAGSLCDQIPVLADINVAHAYKHGESIAPAAEMTLAGLQESENEAYEALLDVYAMSYQRVVDEIHHQDKVDPAERISLTITNIADVCSFLGTYQAYEDIDHGIDLDSSERMADVGDAAFEAALEEAQRAATSYYEVCASHLAWELESAGRVLFAEDVVRVEKAEDGVRLVMKDSAKHAVVAEDVSAAVYASLLAAAENIEGEKLAVVDGLEGIGSVKGKEEAVGGGYPSFNANSASESLYG